MAAASARAVARLPRTAPAAAAAQTAIDKEHTMWRVIRSTFLASIILFGASAASALDGFAQEIEDVEEGECGGEIEPICRTRTRERCVEWYACAPFTICCKTWQRSTVRDYFRPGELDPGTIYD